MRHPILDLLARRWHERGAAFALSCLDDRTLADMGIGRDEIVARVRGEAPVAPVPLWPPRPAPDPARRPAAWVLPFRRGLR